MENKIEKIRVSLGMSRKNFAEALGITVGAVSNYEYGSRLPNPSIAYRILDLAREHGKPYRLEDIYQRKEFKQ